MVVVAGCTSQADVVSKNLSTAAEEFEISRRTDGTKTINLQQDTSTLVGVEGESFWWNHRFKITLDWRMRRYITKNLEVYLVSDIMTNHVRN